MESVLIQKEFYICYKHHLCFLQAMLCLEEFFFCHSVFDNHILSADIISLIILLGTDGRTDSKR